MTIHKKLLRDLYEHKGANIAIIIIITIAIMTFSGAKKTMDDIVVSKEKFYDYCDFPDAYAKVLSAPMDFADSFKKIEGIRTVEPRMSQNVKILGTNKVLRLISGTKTIGKYQILAGREPREGSLEILLGNRFAEANDIALGDSITLLYNGKTSVLNVCGFARSAENVFSMKDENAIFSDPSEFDVSFIELPVMKKVTGRDSFDELVFALERGVNFADVKNDIAKACDSYGLISVYSREDHPSDLIVSGEIKELKTTMFIMPLIFLLVAAMVMSIMIKRIISQQRGQIGVLKAFGYTDVQVGMHYMLYCAILGTLGGAMGLIVAPPITGFFLKLYRDLFNMEFLVGHSSYYYWLGGISLSAGFCAIVGAIASMKAVKIEPAEAMRQEAPKSAKKSFIENFKTFDMVFDMRGKMAVRNILRTRKRSFFIVLGLALAFAILVMPWSLIDIMDDMLYGRYEHVEKYDAKVNLASFIPANTASLEAGKLEGVYASQPLLTVPTTLKHSGLKEDVGVIGIPKESHLYTVVDEKNKPVKIASSGIIISEPIAKKLGITVGDELIFKSIYSKYPDEETSIIVSDIVAQGVGMNAYMDLELLSDLLGYRPICNKILLNTDNEEVIKKINTHYDEAHGVVSVQSKNEIIEQTKLRMDGAYSSVYGMAVIAMLMSFAIVYNIYLVVILERKHEFATLMVLGMRTKEVLNIVSLEQWILAFISVILGAPIAKLMIVAMSENLSTDMFTMPSDVKISAVLIALALMVVSVLVAQLFAYSKLKEIDMVEALKAGE